MTDKQFTKLLRRTAKAYNKYKTLLDAAEREYEYRYGDNPSNRDDDGWIDAMHGAGGLCHEGMTATMVHQSAYPRALASGKTGTKTKKPVLNKKSNPLTRR